MPNENRYENSMNGVDWQLVQSLLCWTDM